MSKKRSTPVAYHEAGHAVISWHLQEPFSGVTIIPEGKCRGRVIHDKGPFESDEKRKLRILSVHAGPIAELKGIESLEPGGSYDDFDYAMELAYAIKKDELVAKVYNKELKIDSERLVERYWNDIQRLAYALDHQKTMTWAEVDALLRTRQSAGGAA